MVRKLKFIDGFVILLQIDSGVTESNAVDPATRKNVALNNVVCGHA